MRLIHIISAHRAASLLATSAVIAAGTFLGCGGGSDDPSDGGGPTGAGGDGSAGSKSNAGGAAGHAGSATSHGGASGAGGKGGALGGGAGASGKGGAAGQSTGGKGGMGPAGGSPGAGGKSPAGGAPSTGGQSGLGGDSSAGGQSGLGGDSSAGGSGLGGDSGVGGDSSAGGQSGLGGDSGLGGSSSTGGAATGGSGGTSSGSTNQSWVWVYTNWTASATAITSHPKSFTHISPTFYDLNQNYTGGLVPYWNCSSSNPCKYEGKTPGEYTAELKAAGMLVVPAIYAGAANSGTDANVKDILDDKNGEMGSFISAMVDEAVTQGYAGYNLDWELGGIGSSYADKFVTFVNAFKAGLAPHGMILTADAIVSNVNGTWCSSNNGYMDFAKLAASSIDSIIIEDYTGSLGATTSCQSAVLDPKNPISCPLNQAGNDVVFTGLLDFMCSNLPLDKVVVGFQSDSGNTNPIAGAAISATESYGFKGVAVWPQVETGDFMSAKNLNAPEADWYGVLADFLAH